MKKNLLRKIEKILHDTHINWQYFIQSIYALGQKQDRRKNGSLYIVGVMVFLKEAHIAYSISHELTTALFFGTLCLVCEILEKVIDLSEHTKGAKFLKVTKVTIEISIAFAFLH